jgi:hypothetical protein
MRGDNGITVTAISETCESPRALFGASFEQAFPARHRTLRVRTRRAPQISHHRQRVKLSIGSFKHSSNPLCKAQKCGQADFSLLAKRVLMVTTTRSAIPTKEIYQEGGAPSAII